MYCITVQGEPYEYLPDDATQADIDAAEARVMEESGADYDDVFTVEDATPCEFTIGLFGDHVCTTCGTYCACYVCGAW